MTLNRYVPPARVTLDTSVIQNGAAVRGVTFSDIGLTANWLAGRGRQLIPAFNPLETHASASTRTYKFRAPQSATALERVWSFAFFGAGRPGVKVPASTGSTVVAEDYRYETLIRETVAAPSSSVVELTCDITSPAGLSTTIHRISCVELPRAVLTQSEAGVVLPNLEPGDPISEAGTDDLPVAARSPNLGRRVLLQYAQPVETPRTTTSSTFQPVLPVALPVLGRVIGSTDTKRSITIEALASVSGGGGGEVRVTPSKGSAATQAISATSMTWVSWTASIDAEDMSTANGERGGSTDYLTIEYRATAGTLSLASVSIYETAI